jgi:hypothetical protein
MRCALGESDFFRTCIKTLLLFGTTGNMTESNDV